MSARFIVDREGHATDLNGFRYTGPTTETSRLANSMPFNSQRPFKYKRFVKVALFFVLMVLVYKKGGDYVCSNNPGFTSQCTPYMAVAAAPFEARLERSETGKSTVSLKATAQASIGSVIQVKTGEILPLSSQSFGDQADVLSKRSQTAIVIPEIEPNRTRFSYPNSSDPYVTARLDEPRFAMSNGLRLRLQEIDAKSPSTFLAFKIFIAECRWQFLTRGGSKFGCVITPEVNIPIGSIQLKAGIKYQIRLDPSRAFFSRLIGGVNGQTITYRNADIPSQTRQAFWPDNRILKPNCILLAGKCIDTSQFVLREHKMRKPNCIKLVDKCIEFSQFVLREDKIR